MFWHAVSQATLYFSNLLQHCLRINFINYQSRNTEQTEVNKSIHTVSITRL